MGITKVLIVDDQTLPRVYIGNYLRKCDFEIIEASSGQKALELLEKDKEIKLMVTDLVMPEMSGQQLIEQVSQIYPELPIIVVTGVHQHDLDDLEKVKDKAAAYFVKSLGGIATIGETALKLVNNKK